MFPFGKEPAVFFNGLAEVVRVVIPMLILFNLLIWDEKQVAGVMLVVSVVASFLSTLLTRSNSVSTLVADKQIEVAKASAADRPTDQIVAQAAKETA